MENERSRFAVTAPKLASWVAVLTVVVGIAALLGWTFDIEVLKSVLPGWVAMKANTAVCFILTGVALYAVHLAVRGERVEPPASQLEPFDKLITSDLAGVVGQPSRMASSSISANGNFSKVNSIGAALWLTAHPHSAIRNQKSAIFLARLCLLLAGLIGLLSLGEYIFDWNPGIDQWLFIEPNGTVGTSYPGRMAPETALSFVLLAAALWITGSSHQTRWTVLAAANFGLLVTALALAAMLSYLTPGIGSFGWFGLTIMAMNTAILFAMLGVAVIAINWQQQDVLQWSLSRHTTAAFACGMALLVFVGLNTSRSQFWMIETNQQIAHTEKMLFDADNVLVGIIEAQGHSRDYLITGDEQFLKLYLLAKADSQAKLDALYRTEFASGEPEHQQHFTQIEAQVQAQFQLLQQIIDARRTGIDEAARSNMLRHGEDLLNKFRSTLDQNKSDDRQIIEQLKREARNVAQLSFLSIFIGTLASLLIFMTVIFRLNSVMNERIRAEESSRKLSQVVEQSPSSIVITDLDANIEYANKTFVRTTGYSLAELVGQNPRLLRSDKTPDETYKDMWAHLTRGEIWRGEFINRRKDGSEFTEEALVSPMHQPDGRVTHYMAIKKDITQFKQIENTLRESEEKFSRIFESNPAMVAIGTLDGTMVDVNLSYADFLGFTRQEMLGKSLADLGIVSAEELRRLLELGHRADESLRDVEVTLLARGGKRLNALLSAEIVTLGGVRYRLATLQDITVRKQVEAQLIEQLDELQRWHDVTSSREGRIIDIKHEVNELLAQAGQPPRYPSAEQPDAESALRIVEKANPI